MPITDKAETIAYMAETSTIVEAPRSTDRGFYTTINEVKAEQQKRYIDPTTGSILNRIREVGGGYGMGHSWNMHRKRHGSVPRLVRPGRHQKLKKLGHVVSLKELKSFDTGKVKDWEEKYRMKKLEKASSS